MTRGYRIALRLGLFTAFALGAIWMWFLAGFNSFYFPGGLGRLLYVLSFAFLSASCLSLWLLRPRKRLRHGECPRCGYDLTGNTTGMCPECGARRITL